MQDEEIKRHVKSFWSDKEKIRKKERETFISSFQ